ncbi:MAG: DMT family transporter [Clostridia bacterium]|nr:DMT family transporter [Clostridia bacterium]
MSKKLRADIVLLFLTAFWGISFPLMRNVLAYIPAIPYLAIRFIIAAIVVSIVFFNKHRHIGKIELRGGIMIGFLLFAGMVLQVYGLYSTTASNSAFITSMSVAFVPILLAIFFRTKTGKFTIWGIVIASIGLFLISGIIRLSFNIGDFLTLLCAISFALQIIFIDRFTKKGRPGSIAIIQLWTAAMLTSIIWLIFDRGNIIINTEVIIVILVTAIFGTAFAFSAQILVQKDTTPSHAALIFTMEPLFALFFALIIPDSSGNVERLTLISGIGCFLILAGTVISEFRTLVSKRNGRMAVAKKKAKI